jgi:hypothetical protein
MAFPPRVYETSSAVNLQSHASEAASSNDVTCILAGDSKTLINAAEYQLAWFSYN